MWNLQGYWKSEDQEDSGRYNSGWCVLSLLEMPISVLIYRCVTGVEDGMMIRVPGGGDAPVTGSGANGDLLVRINVAASKVFQRQGSNLFHSVKIPMHTALLGGRVRVPTLDGDVEVRVPSGTQPDEEMVLKGRGVPRVHGSDSGDLYVSFTVVLPR
jgi:molecular chaperone DnaJ